MRLLQLNALPPAAAAAAYGTHPGLDALSFAEQAETLSGFAETATRDPTPALRRAGCEVLRLPLAPLPMMQALARERGLETAAQDWITAALAGLIRDWRPEAVLTSGPGAFLVRFVRAVVGPGVPVLTWPTAFPAEAQPWTDADRLLLPPGLQVAGGAVRVETLPPVLPAGVARQAPLVDVCFCGGLTDNAQLQTLTNLGRAPLGFGGEFELAYAFNNADEGWPGGVLMYDRGPLWGRDRLALQAQSRMVIVFPSPVLADRLVEIAACGAVPLVPAGTPLPEGFQRDRDLACFDGPDGLEPLVYRLLGDPAALEALAAGADEARRLHDGERVAGRLLDLIGGAGGSS